MDKIKVKDRFEKGIKTLDKKAVQTQKIKNNIVTTKEKIEEFSRNDNEDSFYSYGTTKIQNSESVITRDGIYKGNQLGKKSFNETRNNIENARNKIQDYKQKKVKEKLNKQIKSKDNKKRYIKGINNNSKNVKLKTKQIKTTNSKNLSRRTIKTAEKTLKTGQKVAKETLKTSQKMIKQAKIVAKQTIKGAKVVAKAVVHTVKAVIAATKALISAIIAGGWVAVVIIIVMCIIGAVFASIFGSGDDTSNITSNYEYVMVAKSQIGNAGGEKFWRWYGFEERVEWCAIFVSWCAEQTGEIEKGNIPKYSVCTDGINWFKSKHKYVERENQFYIPRAGDIIFFDWIEDDGTQDGISDHTGIVERVDMEANKVYTIEGNSGDACKEQSYNLDSTQIMGYGTPNQEFNFTEPEHNEVILAKII